MALIKKEVNAATFGGISCSQVTLDISLGQLSRILDHDHFAVVVHRQNLYTTSKDVQQKETIFGLVTRIDLLNFITRAESSSDSSLD